MFRLISVALLTGAAAVYGGVLYLELPPAYDAEMVCHPTDEDRADIRDFILGELAKVNNEYTCRLIVLTKNGKAVFRDFGQRTEKDTEAPPTLGHVYFHPGYGWTDKKWDDLWYHLHWIGEAEGYYGVYDIAYDDVFGPAYAYDMGGGYPPVIERNVNVNLEPTAPSWGFYDISSEEIYLRDWRAGNPGEDEIVIDTDRAYFTRLMLHAFRGRWIATWDQFDAGTVHAAWLETQARLYRMGYETHFNDLGHYEKLPNEWEYHRPYYTYWENYNVPGIATRLESFDHWRCDLHPILRRYRYGTCGYCWWQVLHHDTDFIKDFNGELCKIYQILWPGKPNYDQLYWAARVSYDGGPISGLAFEDWFAAQPILNKDWAPMDENICVPVVSKSTVEVFNYERHHNYGGEGEDWELAENCEWQAKVALTKTNWDDSGDYIELTDLDAGYGAWHPNMNYDDGKFNVKSEYFEWKENPPEWESLAWGLTYGVDTNEAYETDEVFAVVSDAVNGEGWLDVSYNGGAPVRYPVTRYVARIPNFVGGDEAGAGEYEFAYIQPGFDAGVESDFTRLICKDGGSFFDCHAYADIPDKTALAPLGPDGGHKEDAEKVDFGPPVASVGTSPSVGGYSPPTAADYSSPVARGPEGAGADVPGADLPPNDPPALTSADNPGGDWLSPGVVAAPLGRSGPLAAAAPATPLACKPNPVTASATVCFNLEAPGRVHLAVYDLSGRRVATLADGPYAAGNHVAYWRADVPTGVYIYRLQAGAKVTLRKVVVAK